MPYIELKTSLQLLDRQKKKIAERLVKAYARASAQDVAANVLTCIQDNCFLCFRGTDEPSAILRIGPGPMTPKEDYAGITAAFFTVLEEEISIPTHHIYITIEPIQHWGYDGRLL